MVLGRQFVVLCRNAMYQDEMEMNYTVKQQHGVELFSEDRL